MTLVSFGTESDSSQKAHLEALLGLGLRVGVTGWVCQLPRRPRGRRTLKFPPCCSPFCSPPRGRPRYRIRTPLRREPESSFLNNIQFKLNII